MSARQAMTMIERVARAICAEDGQDWRTLESTYNGRQRLHDYRRFARAAIAAFLQEKRG